jgi:hypothetical protein
VSNVRVWIGAISGASRGISVLGSYNLKTYYSEISELILMKEWSVCNLTL